MPKRKDEVNKSENIKIRLTPETRERCAKARLSGAHKLEAESSFLGFLIELGMAKYENALLPIERGEDDVPEAPAAPASKKRTAS